MSKNNHSRIKAAVPKKCTIILFNCKGQAVLEGMISLSMMTIGFIGLSCFLGLAFCKIWLSYQTRSACYCLLSQAPQQKCISTYKKHIQSIIPTQQITVQKIQLTDTSAHLTAKIKTLSWEIVSEEHVEIKN